MRGGGGANFSESIENYVKSYHSVTFTERDDKNN